MNGNDVTVISLRPADVWKYSLQNRQQLCENLVSIAENKDTKSEVFITIEDDLTMVYVYCGDKLEYEEAIISNDDATKVISSIYEKYIVSSPISDDIDSDSVNFERVDLEDDMYNRESELHDACYQFLDTLLESSSECFLGKETEDAIQKMLYVACICLAKNFGLSVRRPMFIEDIYVEFPYDGIVTGIEECEVE